MFDEQYFENKLSNLEIEWNKVSEELKSQYQTAYGVYVGKKAQLEEQLKELRDDGKPDISEEDDDV